MPLWCVTYLTVWIVPYSRRLHFNAKWHSATCTCRVSNPLWQHMLTVKHFRGFWKTKKFMHQAERHCGIIYLECHNVIRNLKRWTSSSTFNHASCTCRCTHYWPKHLGSYYESSWYKAQSTFISANHVISALSVPPKWGANWDKRSPPNLTWDRIAEITFWKNLNRS